MVPVPSTARRDVWLIKNNDDILGTVGRSPMSLLIACLVRT